MPESTPFDGMESWPIAVGQEKRYDGGAPQSHVQIGSAALGRNPADGARPDSRRAPARGVLERPAQSWPLLQSARRLAPSRPGRTAATAAPGRPPAVQGRPD